jgi:hypothetical protein
VVAETRIAGIAEADRQNRESDHVPATQKSRGRPAIPAIPAIPQIPKLSMAKAALPAVGEPKSWDAADYKAFFDERAAILEFDNGLTPSKAEARALECTVVEWLNGHPSRSPSGHCGWCGKPVSDGAAVVPFGVGHCHAWLHPQCWPAWYRRRRADALAALRSFGFPVSAQPTERDSATDTTRAP